MKGIREVRPSYEDMDLVRAAVRLADRDERPSDGVSELVKVTAFYLAGGVALVAGAFALAGFMSLAPEARLRILAVIALVFGSAWLLHAVARVDWLEVSKFAPRPRQGRSPRRPDDLPAQPPMAAASSIAAADVVPPLAGGRDWSPALSNTEARARRGEVRLFGMEIPEGESIEDFARSLGALHNPACTNCERGGHPDFCSWLPIGRPNRLEAGGMGRCRVGWRQE